MPAAIPAVIRDLRNRLNLSQEQLAQRLNVSFASVNRWENGRAQPDRKSTRLNSSHRTISYAVFCLKKKIITTIMATIQRINIIGSREGSRNRRRLKANQTGKKFRVGIKSNISTNRNNLISGVDRCIHLNAMKKTTITSINRQTIKI